MKFADLISRLESYFKENPIRLDQDLSLVVDEFHNKYSEYKRIKKVVFKRQLEKAYEILAKNDKFITTIEQKIDQEQDDRMDDGDDLDLEDETIDEQALGVAIKGDNTPTNDINNMITDFYKANNQKKKSNLKATSMFDEATNCADSIRKKVTFKDLNQTTNTTNTSTTPTTATTTATTNNENDKKRKFSTMNGTNENSAATSTNQTSSLDPSTSADKTKQQKTRPQNASSSYNYKKPSSSSSSSMTKDLIKSQINFEMFACDDELKENIFRRIYYILSPEQFLENGKIPPRGFLLHGPPGCGKSQLVYAIAGELDLPLLKVTSTELISGVSGESEENIRAIFDKAIINAPCVLFIDEIEAISQRRESASKNMEHRIVTQLLSCFDDLAMKPYVPLVVIGATNQADSLDIGLRRAGRFDQEIPIGIPDDKQRRRILEILCRKLKKKSDINMDSIVMNTPGYVGADLNALIDEALISALDRRLTQRINAENSLNTDLTTNCNILLLPKKIVSQVQVIDWIKMKLNNAKIPIEVTTTASTTPTPTPSPLPPPPSVQPNEKSDCNLPNDDSQKITSDPSAPSAALEEAAKSDLVEITQNDFEIAIRRVQPSSKREGFATVPDVSWDDIGALEKVRDELKTAILAPVKYSRQCEIFNFTKPPGILMVGPPGCGKTLLAKAIAKESGINFISVKGPELLNMYVGESERAVRSLFQRARNSKPCVIFFDEIDAICVKRSDSSRDSGSTTRIVNQMLTEMDGLECRKGVFLMAASNRPDIIDAAILRPGRLDKLIYVGLPTYTDRIEILKTITKNGTRPKLDSDVNFEVLAKDERSQTFTGADLSALVREASEFALKEFIKNPISENEIVRFKHFEFAFQKIKPSVSLKDCERYEKMKSMCVNLESVANLD